MANSALERVLAAVNNGQRGNSSDLSSFVSNYAKTSREALEKQRKQNEESALRGQQIIEAQKARDIINKAASNTAATYDFAHGQLPSISNAQAFQNTQRQTSLDDSLNQIMGNNVLTDAGRVSRAQEAYGSLLSAPTVSENPTAREIADAYRQAYANNNLAARRATEAVAADKEARRQQEAADAQRSGNTQRIAAINHALNQAKADAENTRRTESNIYGSKNVQDTLDRRAELVNELNDVQFQLSPYAYLDEASAAEFRRRDNVYNDL
jgi:hypothetical protein